MSVGELMSASTPNTEKAFRAAKIEYSGIAQLAEQRTVNPLVVGSSPTSGASMLEAESHRDSASSPFRKSVVCSRRVALRSSGASIVGGGIPKGALLTPWWVLAKRLTAAGIEEPQSVVRWQDASRGHRSPQSRMRRLWASQRLGSARMASLQRFRRTGTATWLDAEPLSPRISERGVRL